MPCTCSDRRRRGGLAALLLATAACTLTTAPSFPRPPRPLPAEVRERFVLPGKPSLLRLDRRGDGSRLDGDLACGAETIHFHLYKADRPDRPFVLLVPILAGGDDLMRTLATRFVDNGFHAAFCERAGPALRPPQRGADLERLFRRTVLHQRALLAWLPEFGELQPTATFACGVSMGGMVTDVLAAVEPRLEASAVCLAGADLPTIVADSNETRIESWRRWRRTEDGIAGAPLRQELRSCLQSDPLYLAPCVATERVFLVATDFDDVVRPEHQRLLWEAFGRPERMSLPLGHYSAALALDSIVGAISGFFRDRMAAAAHDRALVSGPAGAPGR